MLVKSVVSSLSIVFSCVFVGYFNVQKATSATNIQTGSNHEEEIKHDSKLISIATPTTYYVSGSGSDSNSGLSTSSPFRTIQKAADLTNPGDRVLIMNGVYTNAYPSYVVYLSRSGTNNAWIKFQAYPGHSPKIKHNGWHGILITKGASYIEIKGLEVEGNNANITLDYAKSQQYNGNNPLTNGNCISIDGQKTTHSHHIRILNNKVHNCGGSGIGAAQTDYLTIDGNEVFNNAWYSIHANSGIVLYQNWNSDTNKTDYKMYVTNNKVYNNRQYIPWIVNGKIVDGNGIIVDDSQNTQNGSTLGAYQGRTLIANNLSYKNGGSGILSFRSDRIDVINNTLYLNSLSPEITKGQLGADESSNVMFFNNIVYSSPDKKVNSAWLSTNVTYKKNMYFNSSKIYPVFSSDIVANPQFINPSTADFRLKTTSPAINSGVNFIKTDFLNNPRPSGSASDIGAYEYQF